MQQITNVFLEILVQLHNITGSLGWSILAFTFLARSILLPLSLPSLKSQKKIKEVQPELKKLQEKHRGDKKALQVAQMELYKKYNINPLAGCLPQILQLGLLILLYHVLINFISTPEINGVVLNPKFFWLDLAHADKLYVLPVLAGITQLILSLMIAPGGEVRDVVPNDSKSKKVQVENKKEEDMAQMAATMQKQMLFVMPVMTAFLALSFPSGLALYWVATTVFSIIQQYFFSGWGGLSLYSKRILAKIRPTTVIK